ncbi:rhodanese-related sulfurtransferase [Aeromonas sp. BIGb0405]|uniref:rhodanese-like domain-containing protein n=1 Tax=Aeromonas sp. BIGb0405 TaxID=2940592 RepID=UPI00216779D9|nr:rhodanese-like domain-containing protein [Aeromonas sp. BIGb0405]MCS3455621.1 rhodanese-related sulfurtransferase [Aeromonas sp. BIGb0405]
MTLSRRSLMLPLLWSCLCGAALFGSNAMAVVPIDQQTLQSWQKQSSKRPLLLDVRTKEEFAEGHIPGAINISHDQLIKRLAEIGDDRRLPVVVYCQTGRRAALAEAELEKAGFSHVYHLSGDYQGWVKSKQAVTK